MEQIQVSATTSRNFSDDPTSVYELIKPYRNQVNSEDRQFAKSNFRGRVLTVTTVAIIFIGGLYAALSFLPVSVWGDSTEEIRLVLQLMVLLVYILGGASLSLQYFSFKEIFKDFTGQTIGFVKDSAKD
jgi:ABC-type polysaccharide/polyol phosphate export permease